MDLEQSDLGALRRRARGRVPASGERGAHRKRGRKWRTCWASGEVAAAIGIESDSPDVKPLIPNALDAGLTALRQRGHYPINHLVVVKDDLLAEHPDLAADIFGAFAEAKRAYLETLKTGQIAQPTAVDKLHQRVMEITGDPLPYGVEPNRRSARGVDSARRGTTDHR